MWKRFVWNNEITNYEVSENGEIKSLFTGKILKQSPTKDGYFSVILHLRNGEKGFRVHRIVALAFIDNPESKPYVNHIDGNKRNNVVTNLEWVTPRENTLHAIKIGLMPPTKCIGVIQYDLDGTKIRKFPSLSEASRSTKIQTTHIMECCQKKRLTAGNFQWGYERDEIEKLESINNIKTKSKKILQINVQTGLIIKTYQSIHEAAKAVNGTASAISRIVNNKTNNKTHKGFTWRLADEIVQEKC